MNQQMPTTTPFSVGLHLTGWLLSTGTTEHGLWRTQLTLLLWTQGRVVTTTFEFELEPQSETVAFLERVLTLGVAGELPLRRLLSTLRELCTHWGATSQSVKSPRIGSIPTSRLPSLDMAKSISGLTDTALVSKDGSERRSRKPARKVAGTTRRRRSSAGS